jgi:hypothetical protein
MMNEHGKSDRPTVPEKSPNNAGQPAAEGMEGRGLAKGDKKLRFTALLHHIYNLETLRRVYFSLKKEAASGVDGETWRHYGETLEDNLQDLELMSTALATLPLPCRAT